MFCKEYQYIDTMYNNDGTVNYFLIYVELYSSTVPSTLPTNAVGIDNFPSCYDPALVKFAPGSVLVAVEDKKIYMVSTDFQFKLFKEIKE